MKKITKIISVMFLISVLFAFSSSFAYAEVASPGNANQVETDEKDESSTNNVEEPDSEDIIDDGDIVTDFDSKPEIPDIEDKIEIATGSTANKNEMLAPVLMNQPKTVPENLDWEYYESYGKIIITGYLGTDTDIVIPNLIEGKQVYVQDGAFQRMGITSVIISEGVQLGTSVFDGCDKLESAIFEGIIEEIPDRTFAYCSSLNSIEMQPGLKRIGQQAFLRCTQLNSFDIPDTVESVDKDAFFKTGYINFHIPQNVKTFESLLGDNTIYIDVDSKNVTYTTLEGLLVSKDNTVLICYPRGLLNGVIELPRCITTIRDITNFQYGPSDGGDGYSIFIGNEVTSILNKPLSRTFSTIWTPANSYMADYSRVNNLLYLNYCDRNNFWAVSKSPYRLSIYKDGTLSLCGFKESTVITDFVIPNRVGNLEITNLDHAFYNIDLSNLESITIPDTVHSIDESRLGSNSTYYVLNGLSKWDKNKLVKIINDSNMDIDLSLYEETNVPVSYGRVGGEGWYLNEKSGGNRLTHIPPKTTVYKHYGISYTEMWRTENERKRSYQPDNFGINEEVVLPASYRSGYSFDGWEFRRDQVIKTKSAAINENLDLYAKYNSSSSGSSGGSGGGGGGSSSKKSGTTSSAQNTPGLWKQDEKGWWFQKQDGSYPKNEWIMNNNVWYRFDPEGYMQTGWIEIDKIKYFLNPNGAMISNDWSLQNDKWYFFDSSGAMNTGWVNWKDKWYYLNSDGSMAVNISTPDGYTVNANGEWVQ